MKTHIPRPNCMMAMLVSIGIALLAAPVANSSAQTFTSERQVDINDRFEQPKPVAGRNRRRLKNGIILSNYPRANADRVRVSKQTNKLRINVLSNDWGQKLRVVDINSRSASGAHISIKNDTAVYQTPQHFVGLDSFWYTLEDKSGRQHSAKVIVCICDK